MAAECYATGRVDDSVSYVEAGRPAIESGRFDEVPYEFEVALGATYATTGQTDQLSCAATSSHENQVLMSLPGRSW